MTLLFWILLPSIVTGLCSLERRNNAATNLQEHILPAGEYARRTRLGRQAQGVVDDDHVIPGQDERLFQTYGEFPLDSLDTLLDRALQHQQEDIDENRPLTVVDLGSGCGRLILYMALTRPTWNVHGIELSSILYREAVEARERAIAGGWLQMTSSLEFHCGAASQFPDLLRQADLIFCYSTAFESSGFSPQTGTMVLGPEWNELLAVNRKGIIITTDKSLDSRWRILERLDVPNPEVFESTGFIHCFQGRV
jgi:hypothetical protein